LLTSLRLVSRVLPPAVLPAVALLGLVVEFASLRAQAPYLRSWTSVIEAVNGSWVVMSLIAAAAAALGTSLSRDQSESLAAMTGRARRWPLGISGTVGLVSCAVHVVVVIGLLVWGYLRGLPGDPNPLPCCVALAAILAAALVGGLLGTTNARGLEPVVAVVAILALIYGVRLAGGRALIDIDGVSVVLIGVRHRSVVTLWQMAFYLSLIGTLSLALTSSWTRSKARMVLAIGATALVGLSLVVAVPVRFEGSPNQWVCDPATPRVCVSAEDANRLAEYAPAVRRIAKVAPLVGLETHAKYRQTVGITCGPGSFSLDPALSMHQLTFDFVQFSVPCSGQWGTAQLDDADMVADWLRAELSLPMSVLGQERGRPSVEDARAALDRLECSP
jgi:hypothetical protein